MELIDKQKLLEWIKAENGKVSDPAGGEAYILFYLREHIESGTFDDHSAQEEVAKLKETFASEVNRLESELEKCHTHGLRLSSRAIQAEQEREKFERLFNGEMELRHWWMNKATNTEEERNALLEGLTDNFRVELALMRMWDTGGIKEIYKYKHRIKAFREPLTNYELFCDMSYQMFTDVVDIASRSNSSPEEYKVSVKELIAARSIIAKIEGSNLNV